MDPVFCAQFLWRIPVGDSVLSCFPSEPAPYILLQLHYWICNKHCNITPKYVIHNANYVVAVAARQGIVLPRHFFFSTLSSANYFSNFLQFHLIPTAQNSNGDESRLRALSTRSSFGPTPLRTAPSLCALGRKHSDHALFLIATISDGSLPISESPTPAALIQDSCSVYFMFGIRNNFYFLFQKQTLSHDTNFFSRFLLHPIITIFQFQSFASTFHKKKFKIFFT